MKIRLSLAALAAFALVLVGFNLEEDQEPKTSLLWKIEKEGHQTSYVFGTMHMIQKEFFYFPESLKKIVKKSDVVVTEIDLDELTNQAAMMPYLTLKEGSMLDFFKPAQQDSLFTWAKTKLQLDKEMFTLTFGKMKPFVLIQTMIQLEMMGKTESYELTIADLAKKYKKETLGLETIAEQIGFFDDLSQTQQADMVMEGLRKPQEQFELLDQMQGLYLRQQIDSLYLKITTTESVIKQEEALFLRKRNANWVPQIDTMSEKKSLFVAVGAGHLAGNQGVLQGLRNRGFKVSPVKF